MSVFSNITKILLIVTLAPTALVAQEDFKSKPPDATELAEMQKRWENSSKPGKHHKWLARLVGEWETVTRVSMGGGANPIESKGTTKVAWKVDGKWLWMESQGTLFGRPIRSFLVLGYDNFKQKFVASGFDSYSTALQNWEGTLDQSGNVLRQWGLMDEPMTGEHDKTVEFITRIYGPDKWALEVLDLPMREKDNKVVEIIHLRKK